MRKYIAFLRGINISGKNKISMSDLKTELENALEELEFRQADITDAELLVEIYNASFYNDYIKYGECPAYGKTKEVMEKSIKNYPKFIILCDGSPVGCVSCKK